MATTCELWPLKPQFQPLFKAILIHGFYNENAKMQYLKMKCMESFKLHRKQFLLWTTEYFLGWFFDQEIQSWRWKVSPQKWRKYDTIWSLAWLENGFLLWNESQPDWIIVSDFLKSGWVIRKLVLDESNYLLWT